MTPSSPLVLIVGGGVAGTALAWTLFERRVPFLLVDDQQRNSASRVAAGLITPITGKRVNRTYAWSPSYGYSKEFYERVEQRTNCRVWYDSGAARVLSSDQDAQETRIRLARFSDVDITWLTHEWFDSHWKFFTDAFFMPTAARLYTHAYLSASHEFFEQQDAFNTLNLDPACDFQYASNGVDVDRLKRKFDIVVFARGYADHDHPLFSEARFKPAQGDILRVRTNTPIETTTMHQKIWFTPANPLDTLGCLNIDCSRRPRTDDWLLGATYQWRPLDNQPNAAGRDSLVETLSTQLQCPVTIQDHRAAVRPTTFDQLPFLGIHPEFERVGIINGLGAKGCYLAPWCAKLLADQILFGTSVPVELRWNR